MGGNLPYYTNRPQDFGRYNIFTKQLCTSYTQIVDKISDGGQLCFQNVDDFRHPRYCSKNEKLVTICCISENNDFFRDFSAFFFSLKMRFSA